jgi:hypothetical protein
VVLDTNVFFGDRYAQRQLLNILLEGAANGDYDVVVPEVVVLELVRQFPTELKKAVETARTAIGSMAKELPRFGLEPPLMAEVDVGALADDYERALRARLTTRGVQIAGHPKASLEAIPWAVDGRKPFDENGRGLPDALIWLTTLELAAETGQVFLVSENTNDFGDGNQPPRLAPTLADDLARAGLPPDRVQLFAGLGELVRVTLPPLGAADVRATRLLENPTTRGRLIEAISGQLAYRPLPQEGLYLNLHLEDDPHAVSFDIEDVDLISARQLPKHQLLLELIAVTDLLLDFKVFKGDVYEIEDDPRVSVANPDWNDHYADVELETTARLTLRVVTDLQAENVSYEIVELEELSGEERLDRRLTEELTASLGQLVAQAIISHGLPVAEYRPPNQVQGSIDRATVEEFIATAVEVREVLEQDSVAVTAEFEIAGLAAVKWVATAPSPTDVADYSDSVEGDLAGTGWVGVIETGEPVIVELEATLDEEDSWDEVRAVRVLLEPDERERRLAPNPSSLDFYATSANGGSHSG